MAATVHTPSWLADNLRREVDVLCDRLAVEPDLRRRVTIARTLAMEAYAPHLTRRARFLISETLIDVNWHLTLHLDR